MSKGQSNDLWMTKTPAQNTHTCAYTCPPAHCFPQVMCLPECTHLFLSPVAVWDQIHCFCRWSVIRRSQSPLERLFDNCMLCDSLWAQGCVFIDHSLDKMRRQCLVHMPIPTPTPRPVWSTKKMMQKSWWIRMLRCILALQPCPTLPSSSTVGWTCWHSRGLVYPRLLAWEIGLGFAVSRSDARVKTLSTDKRGTTDPSH